MTTFFSTVFLGRISIAMIRVSNGLAIPVGKGIVDVSAMVHGGNKCVGILFVSLFGWNHLSFVARDFFVSRRGMPERKCRDNKMY